MTNWVIGVDLGGTKVGLGLVDEQNHVVRRDRFATLEAASAAGIVDGIRRVCASFAAELPEGERIVGLGICSPGPLDHVRGLIADPPNLRCLWNVPLRAMLEDAVDMPVVLDHDAKAAALGEYHLGAGRGSSSMVYIVIGTGVGGAIILDGELYRGAHNSSGEIGHVTIDMNGAPCSCGRRGCVETFLSGPNLVRMYCEQSAFKDGFPCEPVVADDISGEIVTRLASQGDALALQVMQTAGEGLGTLVSMLAMTLDIDVFVIGSSVAKAGSLLLDPARRAVPRHAFHSVAERVRILNNELGDDGPILGCAWLIRRHLQHIHVSSKEKN